MNHYEVLGVNKNATQEEIKEAYKKLVKKYHPDIYPGDKTFAEKKIKDINAAYEVLSDLDSKKEYDEMLNPHPPEQTYDFTPPNYSPYSYENYKNRNNYTNYNNSYNNSYYNTSKTENVNKYKNTKYTQDPFSKINNIPLLIVISFTILYCIFNIFSIYFKYLSKKEPIETENKSVTFITTDPTETPDDEEHKEDFDINDYYSDKDLYTIYEKYYYDSFDSFEDFKQALTDLYSTYYDY